MAVKRKTAGRRNSSKTVTQNIGDFKETRPKRISFEVENAENGGFAITARQNTPMGSKQRLFVAKTTAEKNRIMNRLSKGR